MFSPYKIENLLQFINAHNFHTKKAFGQNFLIDENKAIQIVEGLEIKQEDSILEVGPGFGSLTFQILKYPYKKLLLVEKDNKIAEFWDGQKAETPFQIMHNDILDFNPLDHFEKSFKIISNLPYHLSSQILIWTLSYLPNISRMVFTFQKEVADRVISEPQCKDYSLLSVVLQTFCHIQSLPPIKPSCFFPKPGVDSQTLIFHIKEKPPIPFEMSRDYFQFVKLFFLHRRKKIFNNLRCSIENLKMTDAELKEYLGDLQDKRVEYLVPAQFQELFLKWKGRFS